VFMSRFRVIAAMTSVALLSVGAWAQAPSPAPAAPGAPAADAAAGAPKIKFDAITLDLGNVKKGDDAVAEFVFKNEGDAPLKILAAKPG
jgi:hypothetical protein